MSNASLCFYSPNSYDFLLEYAALDAEIKINYICFVFFLVEASEINLSKGIQCCFSQTICSESFGEKYTHSSTCNYRVSLAL